MARNKYPEETIHKILDVSLELFMDKGYEQTTIQDIVDHLGGLTKGAIYHHFKSKEDIIDALGDRMFKANNPFTKVKERTDLSGLEKLQQVVSDSLKQSEEQKALNKISVGIMKNPRFLAEQIQANAAELSPMVKELIAEGIKDGSIKSTYAKPLSEVFVLLLNFWFLPSIYPCTKDEFVEKVLFSKELFEKMEMPIFKETKEELIKFCDVHFNDLFK